MNERTNTLLYKNIPLTLYSRKGWYWLCVRGELETETDCYILTQSSSRNHSSTSFSSWLGYSTVGRWGPKTSVWSWFSLRGHPITNCDWNWTGTDSNWLTQAICGTWLYNCLTPTCFLWAYPSALNSTSSTGQGDILTPLSGRTCLAVFLFTQVHLLIDG